MRTRPVAVLLLALTFITAQQASGATKRRVTTRKQPATTKPFEVFNPIIPASIAQYPAAAGTTPVAGTETTVAALSPSTPQAVIYDAPNGRITKVLKRNTFSSRRPAFQVINTQQDWMQVRLPYRPNGATGWVKTSDMTVYRTDYHIVVSKTDLTLTLQQAGQVVFSTRIGVGQKRWPTPIGEFYVTDGTVLANPKGVHGPVGLSLSAFSDVFQSFAGGPGQIAIHGTNTPNVLPGMVSHGCVRVRNADMTHIAKLVPQGTPVTITP